MADRRWRGRNPDTWEGTWQGDVLDMIYEHYKEALEALPLEGMPSLASRLLAAGVCFGFADPVTNIIVNTLSFCESEPEPEPEPEPNGAKKRRRKWKLETNAEATLRAEILSKIVAGDGPSPPEARTVAERSLEGLVSFLISYFRYLRTDDALRYLSLARADLLVAVSLIQKDRCYRRQDQLLVCSPAVKTALKCAAWSAKQPNFAAFLACSYALASHINMITRTLSAEGCCRLTVQDISWLFRLLAKPLKHKRSDKPMKLVPKRFHDPEITANIENVPGHLRHSLRGTLLDRIHELYLKALSRFPMKDLQTHHHRGLLKAGYCFGPFDPVSNIIVNTVWYDTAFPSSKEFEVDMICTLRHVESRSANGLIAFVQHCTMISEHEAMIYLLKSKLDVDKAIQMAKKSVECDLSICDDNSYKTAAKAASHPNPEAYCKLVLHSLPEVKYTVRSLLQASHVLSHEDIISLSALLSFSSVETLESIIELSENALEMITKYKEDFLTEQNFVHRKVETALRNYEQSKGCNYKLGVICGLNDRVGMQKEFFDTKCQYTHANFWASQDNGVVTLFFAEFVNDEASNFIPRCYPISTLSTQVRCCYCEFEGIRIVHPIENYWQGSNGFESIACGELHFTNAEIVSHWKLIDSEVVGWDISVQDYIYLDPAQDAQLIMAVNHIESSNKLDLDAEMRRIKSVPVAGHYPQQASSQQLRSGGAGLKL